VENHAVEPNPNGNKRMRIQMIAAILIAVIATNGIAAQE